MYLIFDITDDVTVEMRVILSRFRRGPWTINDKSYVILLDCLYCVWCFVTRFELSYWFVILFGPNRIDIMSD